jgi:hypothetical protein
LPNLLDKHCACVNADFFTDLLTMFPFGAYADFDQFVAIECQLYLR